MNIIYNFVLGCFLVANLQTSDHVPTLSVCEALSQAQHLNGKLITLKGLLLATDEGGWLIAERCTNPFMTDDFTWSNSIYLRDPSNGGGIHPVSFTFDNRSAKQALKAAENLKRRNPGQPIYWLYEGLFETRKTWERSKLTYPSGKSRYIGFGHGGDAPAQLVTKAVIGVALE